MASGTFGQAALVAATNTTIYTVPAGKVATATVSICNPTTTIAGIRLAIAAADTPVAAEWIEYGTDLIANSTLERSGIVLSAGKKLVVYSDVANVAVSAYGFEE
jgi:hypothetical protein